MFFIYIYIRSDFQWKRYEEEDFQQPTQNTAVNSHRSRELHLRALSPSAATSVRFLPRYLQVKIQAHLGSCNDRVHSHTHFCSCGYFSFPSSLPGHVLFI